MCILRKECELFNPVWLNYLNYKVLICAECYYWFHCEVNKGLTDIVPAKQTPLFISCVNLQKNLEIVQSSNNLQNELLSE